MTRILIVEDEPAIRAVLRVMLERAGLEVETAGNGEEGIQAFRRQPADLILCDLFMPDRDGLELIRELRQEFPDVKIIAMSGGGFRGTVDMMLIALQFGAADILDKPFTHATVMRVIQRVLQPPA
jgi:CheY-like chemotaxis protein